MPKEIWKPILIEPWCDVYEASNLGRIRVSPRIVTLYTADGYRRAPLRARGIKGSVPVHRLVASAFLGKPKKGQVVNHKNRERGDNRPSNLEWTTVSENTKHGNKDFGLVPRKMRKLIPRLVDIMLKDGYTKSEIAREFGVSVQSVCQMIKLHKIPLA